MDLKALKAFHHKGTKAQRKAFFSFDFRLLRVVQTNLKNLCAFVSLWLKKNESSQ